MNIMGTTGSASGAAGAAGGPSHPSDLTGNCTSAPFPFGHSANLCHSHNDRHMSININSANETLQSIIAGPTCSSSSIGLSHLNSFFPAPPMFRACYPEQTDVSTSLLTLRRKAREHVNYMSNEVYL